MSSREPDWNLWRTFLAVMAEGSLSGAARQLRIAQPTVGRHIDELESLLTTSLFTRSQVGLEPTGAARQLAPHAETMATTAATLLRIASGEAEQVRGTIRITASETIGGQVLPPILGRFRDAWPQTAIELVLSNDTQDLLRREVDIAVRMVQPSQSALVARKIGMTTIGLFAHPRYIAAHGTPESPADLPHHTWIGFDQETAGIRALRSMGLDVDRSTFAIRSDSDLAQLAAVRAGVGIGACQLGLARDPPLVRVLADAFSFDLGIWVAMHEDLKAIRRMRLMFDHLSRELDAYVATSSA
jgi:DNA-binding transcriptional LysR family regulator